MRKTLFDLAGLNFKRNGVGGYDFRFHSLPPLEFAVTVDEIRRNHDFGDLIDPGEIILETYMDRGYEFFPPEYHLAGHFFIYDAEYSLKCIEPLFSEYREAEKQGGLSDRFNPENLFHCLALLRRAKQSDINRFMFNSFGESMVPRIDGMIETVYRMIEFPKNYGQIVHLERQVEDAYLQEFYESIPVLKRLIGKVTFVDPENRVDSDSDLIF